MLRKFAIALLATSVVAGAAFAAEPSGNAGSTAPATTAGSKTKTVAVPAKPVGHLRKHARKHARSHVARGRTHGTKVAHHVRSKKTHKAHLASVTAGTKGAKAATLKSAKLPATRSSTN